MKIIINKKVLAISVLLLGLGTIILTIGLFNPSSKSTTTNTPNNFPLGLSNFTIDTSVDDEVTMTLNIKNNTTKDITNNIIKINFYNKDNYLLHTYEYSINSLKIDNQVMIKAIIGFVYEEISKYEIVFNGKTLELEPEIS